MPKQKSGLCPKCHRRTYSEKWGQCTACGFGVPAKADAVAAIQEAYGRAETAGERRAEKRAARKALKAIPDGHEPPVTETRDVSQETVTEVVPVGALSQKLVTGEPCPLCGKRVGKTAAQRQRERRAK